MSCCYCCAYCGDNSARSAWEAVSAAPLRRVPGQRQEGGHAGTRQEGGHTGTRQEGGHAGTRQEGGHAGTRQEDGRAGTPVCPRTGSGHFRLRAGTPGSPEGCSVSLTAA